MVQYLIVVIFSVGCCAEYDAIAPVNHGSELAKYEKVKEPKDSSFRNQDFKKPESSYEDDLKRIDDDYLKYIDGKSEFDVYIYYQYSVISSIYYEVLSSITENNKGYGNEDYRQRQRRYSNEELDKIFGYTGPTGKK